MTAPEPAPDGEVEALRRGLEGVTPGPWMWRGKDGGLYQEGRGVYSFGDAVLRPTYEYDSGVDTIVNDADAAHIARCSPDAIARLLSRLDAAEERARVADEAREAHAKCTTALVAAAEETARAAVEAKEKAEAGRKDALLTGMSLGLQRDAQEARAEEAESTIASLQSQVEAMRQALEPFAAYIDQREHLLGDREADADRMLRGVTLGDFRRARSTLAASKETGDA